jgi:hypothetical protein
MHLDDGQVQAALHGEVDVREVGALEEHLAQCAECRVMLDLARAEEARIFALLRRLDQEEPALDAIRVATRARRQTQRVWQQAAALLIAIVAGGVAYGVPGSPLRAWVDDVVARITHPGGETRAPAPAPPSRTPGSGIALPISDRFTIRFSSPQDRGMVRVTLTEGPQIVVRAVQGSASFTADVERLLIGNSGSSGDYEIELPQRAPWVEILVGDRRLALKEGPRMSAPVTPDARGGYVIPLGPP